MRTPVKVGDRFGRLVVIGGTQHYKAGPHSRQNYAVMCHCDCGRDKLVVLSALRWGGTRSCGCLADEARRRR